jgi:hypothetical protein
VVVSGKLITRFDSVYLFVFGPSDVPLLIISRGPGTTFPFALTLVELLCGKSKREEVRGPMVFPAGTPW